MGRTQACSINYKLYNNKSLKDEKRTRPWTPVLFQLHLHGLNRRMLLDAPAVSAPSDLFGWTFACVSQNKPAQQRPILQLAYAKLAHSDWHGVRACTKSCAYPLDLRGKWQPVQADLFLSYTNAIPLNHWVE